MPFGESLRLLRAVKGAVDLDRCELAAGIFELTFLREFVGIERPPPGLIGPTANADPNRAGSRADHISGNRQNQTVQLETIVLRPATLRIQSELPPESATRARIASKGLSAVAEGLGRGGDCRGDSWSSTAISIVSRSMWLLRSSIQATRHA